MKRRYMDGLPQDEPGAPAPLRLRVRREAQHRGPGTPSTRCAASSASGCGEDRGAGAGRVLWEPANEERREGRGTGDWQIYTVAAGWFAASPAADGKGEVRFPSSGR